MSSRPQRRHIRTDILAKWRSSQSRRNVRHAEIAVGEVTDGERIVHRGSAHDTNPLSAAACIAYLRIFATRRLRTRGCEHEITANRIVPLTGPRPMADSTTPRWLKVLGSTCPT